MNDAAAITVAFFGDIVGGPGRAAFAHAVRTLRAARPLHAVIVNAENARNGSGLHPEGYREIRAAGADAVTLGDHCFADMRIGKALDDPAEPVCRPANLAPGAPGRPFARVRPATDTCPALYVVTVLGRLFMKIPANDPFAGLDDAVTQIVAADPDALIIAEVHAEASSEKIAMAWHALRRWPGRVLAVVGTHTHVQTADARLLAAEAGAVAAITDLGMTGGQGGVIGRDADAALTLMTTQHPIHLAVTDADPAACGVLLHLSPATRRPTGIEALVIRA